MPDFLLEIGCEEVPARMIASASKELGERLAALLERERLAGSGRCISWLPRAMEKPWLPFAALRRA